MARVEQDNTTGAETKPTGAGAKRSWAAGKPTGVVAKPRRAAQKPRHAVEKLRRFSVTAEGGRGTRSRGRFYRALVLPACGNGRCR